MKIAVGNEKLGTGCIVVSRPVGDTCPSSCEFLGNGCYAEKTEKRFPNARTAGFSNLITEKNKVRAIILNAIRDNQSIRWHERGDFGLNDEIDMAYVNNIVWACNTILEDGLLLPRMWAYTHFYSAELHSELSPFMKLYASVHNLEDKKLAESAGFSLFAWCDTNGEFPNRGKGGCDDAPKLTIIDNEKFVTCPEMRRGRAEGGVTCTGNKNTISCNLCVKGLANVLFLSH